MIFIPLIKFNIILCSEDQYFLKILVNDLINIFDLYAVISINSFHF